MTRVLLSYVNSFMDNLIPIGVSLLSACLKREGHKVELFDTTFYRTREETGDDARVKSLQIRSTNLADLGIREKPGSLTGDFREQINRFNPDLIALSVVEPTYSIAREMLESIRDIKTPKIVGGIHATMAAEEIMRECPTDMVCRGEGEEAIVELASRLDSGKDFSDVQNLVVRKGQTLTANPLRPLVKLDDLPDQDWDIYDRERFFKPMGGKIWVSGPIELTRGCTYRCTFCCNAELQDMYKGIGRYPRERSIAKFMAELKDKKQKFGMQYLYLVAENFLHMSQERFSEFVEGYSDVRLPFWIETRPETVDLEKILKLREVGCEGLSIGIEHGNDQFRRSVLGRKVSNERLVEAFRTAKKSGIRICANNIVGFPTETRDLFFDTVELNRVLEPDNPIINIFSPYRGTKLWGMCVENGYVARERTAGDYRSDATLTMPQLSSSEIRGLQRTFPLYVRLPREMWPQIQTAERFDEAGEKRFGELSKIYKEKYMR